MTIEFGTAKITHTKPFTIGHFPFSLNNEIASRARRDIADWFENNMGSVSRSRENKLKIDTKKDEILFQDFIDKSAVTTKSLLANLQSQQLRRDILKQLWARTVRNRKDRYSLELMLIGLANIDCFETRLELSVMGKDASIVPHTDSIGKIFSGLIYLPTEYQTKHSKKNQLGTTFWSSCLKNFDNKHLTSQTDRDEFLQSAQILTRTPFCDNEMWFFLRNQSSWHSVEKLETLLPDEKRVSINYNILLRGSIVKKLAKIYMNGAIGALKFNGVSHGRRKDEE